MKKFPLILLTLLFIVSSYAQPAYHRIWSVKSSDKGNTYNARQFVYNDTIYTLKGTLNEEKNAIKYIALPDSNTGVLAALGTPDNTTILDIHFDGENYIYVSGNTTQSENFATPGTSRTTYSYNNFTGGDGFVACFSLSGELQWCTYTDGIITEGILNRSIVVDDEGNVYVIGRKSNEELIEDAPFQSTVTQYDEFPLSGMAQTITKLNNQGQYVWSTFFGTRNTIIWDIETVNDGIILMGSVNSGINSPPPENLNYFSTEGAYQENPRLNSQGGFAFNQFINKFNFDGTRAWGTYFNDDAFGINWIETYGNAIYLVSYSHSGNGTIENIATEGAFIEDPETYNQYSALAKMNPDGSGLLWITYTSNSAFSHNYNSVSINSDGNIWLFGQTDSFEGVATENAYQTEKDPTPSYLLSHSDAYHLLLSNDGSTVLYATYFGFDGKEVTGAIFPAENGYYSVEQTSGNSDAENFITQGALLEPDEEGSSTYGGLVYTYFSTEPVSSGTFDKKKISIYPNPAENVLHLTGEIEGFTKIDIYNMQGQRVFQQPINTSEIISVDINSLASGVYLLTISNTTDKQTYRVVKK